MNKILDKLLSDNLGYSPVFGKGFANHVSMGLAALDRLGADDERLGEFTVKSSAILEPVAEPLFEITRADFERQMGNISAFASYLKFFKNLQKQSGLINCYEIIREYLPILIPGLAGGAFHPFIRLAYAVEQKNSDDIIFSLAYFAASNGRLGSFPQGGDMEFDPHAVLKTVRADPGMRLTEKSGLIFDHLKNSAAIPGFDSHVTGLRLDESHLPVLASLVLEIYLSRENIAALHGVTGTHAFRILLPYMTDVKTALISLWQAVVALYVANNAPELHVPQADTIKSWGEIANEAIRSPDVHTIKLIYSSIEEDRLYNNRCYKVAALRRLAMGSR